MRHLYFEKSNFTLLKRALLFSGQDFIAFTPSIVSFATLGSPVSPLKQKKITTTAVWKNTAHALILPREERKLVMDPKLPLLSRKILFLFPRKLPILCGYLVTWRQTITILVFLNISISHKIILKSGTSKWTSIWFKRINYLPTHQKSHPSILSRYLSFS